MSSLNYYNQNARAFFERTLDSDRSAEYAKFLPFLSCGARILDAGCGSGRDTLFFRKAGFEVFAFDASCEMVKLSSLLLGDETQLMHFQDLAFNEEFHAVWASASLLHVSYEELPLVLHKLHHSLKSKGILYASFKHGEGMRLKDTRVFFDMNEKLALFYFNPLFSILEMWTTADRGLTPSPSRMWFNILSRKL